MGQILQMAVIIKVTYTTAIVRMTYTTRRKRYSDIFPVSTKICQDAGTDSSVETAHTHHSAQVWVWLVVVYPVHRGISWRPGCPPKRREPVGEAHEEGCSAMREWAEEQTADPPST